MKHLRPVRTEADYDATLAEVLNRKRGLSIAMIRRLHGELGVPAEVLIRPTKVTRAA